MPTMDVFNTQAFKAANLTAAINKLPFLPSLLGDMSLFESKDLNTNTAYVEERSGVLTLVPTTPRGAPPAQRGPQKRQMRNFNVPHIPAETTINASEIQSVRAFGSETELQSVQALVNERSAALSRDIQLTWENLRLGAIKGTILDADGSTVIYNLFTEFGVTQPTEIDFDLDNASPAEGAVLKLCAQVKRQTLVALDGAATAGMTIHAVCGDTFFDQLTAHAEVREIYKRAASEGFAQRLGMNMAYSSFEYGGIVWHNYRGQGSVAIAATEAKFFPVGVPDLFHMYYSPADTMTFANTRALPLYNFVARDPEFDRWAKVQVESNPLPICLRPLCLQRGRNT